MQQLCFHKKKKKNKCEFAKKHWNLISKTRLNKKERAAIKLIPTESTIFNAINFNDINPKIAKAIDCLWRSNKIQTFFLMQNAKYSGWFPFFLDKIFYFSF